jgi:protein-S-isoprenylcysteine O-methyltransferase Ste14
MTPNPTVATTDLELRLKNIVASVGVVATATGLFMWAWWNRHTLGQLWGPPEFAFTGDRFMVFAATLYSALLVVYYLVDPEPTVSKSLRFWRVAWRSLRSPVAAWRAGLDRTDRVAVLSTLLKAFFAPMMVQSLMIFCVNAARNGAAIATEGAGLTLLGLFDRYGYWFLMSAILFVDVLIFTFGYLIESKRLGNEIKSVDPTFIGWAAALVCYPPFNFVSGKILGTPVSDFPKFEDPTAHLVLNLMLLTLMAIYASASVALGLKGSNLTHRGIVARWPYSVIRHPAYVCKNLAWWIGSLPLVLAMFEVSTFEGIKAIGSVFAWSAIYALRALTEEDHLRSVDGDYAEYAKCVRYRFIPGVY